MVPLPRETTITGKIYLKKKKTNNLKMSLRAYSKETFIQENLLNLRTQESVAFEPWPIPSLPYPQQFIKNQQTLG